MWGGAGFQRVPQVFQMGCHAQEYPTGRPRGTLGVAGDIKSGLHSCGLEFISCNWKTAGQPFSNYTYNYLASGNAAHGTGPTVHADLEPTRCPLRPRISWTCALTAMVPRRRSENIRSGLH